MSYDWQKLTPPGYDPWRDAGDRYLFDADAAERACEFFPKVLSHNIGRFAGQHFQLEAWQRAAIGHLFGWKDKGTGYRRYRECFWFVPRKNGKTTVAAGIALLLLFLDGEQGAQIYSAAANAEQARLVFDAGKQMVLAQPVLTKRAELYKDSILFPSKNSYWKVLNSEAGTKHGLNPHGIIIDELHAHKDRELVEVLMTGTGSRTQPLTVHLTTAGYDKTSICYEKYEYAKRVQEGIIGDTKFLPVIYEMQSTDDWREPSTWEKANPNIGVSVSVEYLEQECQRAKELPAYENTFRRLHLNQWTEQADRWLSIDAWNACEAEYPDLESLPCYGGLDLSTTRDLTAFMLVFDGGDKWYVETHAWIPEDNAYMRERADGVPYIQWSRQSYMETTPGNAVDYDILRQRINQICTGRHVRKIWSDPWNAQQLCQQLIEDGLPVELVSQGFTHLSSPTKELERLVSQRRIVHDGNPVLRWCLSNVTIDADANDNIRVSKKRSHERIDCAAALVMAIGASMTHQGPTESVYETRGMLKL